MRTPYPAASHIGTRSAESWRPRRRSRCGPPAKPSGNLVGRLKQIPSAVIFAGHSTTRNPLYAAYRDDLAKTAKVWGRLLGMHPISVKQQPCRQLGRQLLDQRVQDATVPRRVSDKILCRLPIVESKNVPLRYPWRRRLYVALICAKMPGREKVANQRPVASAGLNKMASSR